ncbi:uncharacterized protein RJT21DRAFT_121905 [Scheffersomyces amazonensis]|uniref:uncharacterized protein n=1 Tax=Scheffersomyces amazonensis TaxID=1078765 RepID=UPI00315CE50D
MTMPDDWDSDEDDSEIEALVYNKNDNENDNENKNKSRKKNKSSSPVYVEIPQAIPGAINHHEIDKENLSTYIYPTNFEVRDYQFNIVKRAFYDNLLVALPTGLGKTFIASTVMLNFLRWFPNSKIIFMAPTKPLVAQQIKACCSITGIPAHKVAILLDKTRKNRQEIWDSKQVFFTTPQVVENDLASNTVDPKSIVLLVIDEAHRAKGNYAYNNAVKYLERFNRSFRILALTATPATTVEGVQEIIDNLKISKVEVRTEQSIDIIKHMKRKQLVRRTIIQSDEINQCIDLLSRAISPILKIANERGIYDVTNPRYINFFTCLEATKAVMMNRSLPQGLKWANQNVLSILGIVGQCYKRLNIYGVRSFYGYFTEKYEEFQQKHNKNKSTNKLSADFYFHESIKELMKRAKEILDDENSYSHPKIEALVDELQLFLDESTNKDDSRVIIFTEYRESALEIVQSIEKLGNFLKPHIFIGQAKEKGNESGKSEKGKKSKETTNRPTNRTSSEDAQINGMNQKLQKEIIKKFKAGTYNILVATSIGEEGLDIGEVDLIICYDSTSSPIKNIQRMGRTGRKRDGKVVLLFSSNEESKFDKAMAGYEYIQQHIMKGELISLGPQNRIIPREYDPQVEKKFIEIPDENKELKVEDDADEIIRIAIQYMLGGGSKKRKSNAKGKSEKKQKQFFMPENVVTGFRSATSLVKRVDIDEDNIDKPREKDFLDKIMDSDTDDEISGKIKKTSKPAVTPDTSNSIDLSTLYEVSDHSSDDEERVTPKANSVEESVSDPIKEPSVELSEVSVREPVDEPVDELVEELVEEPVEELIEKPVIPPIGKPVKAPSNNSNIVSSAKRAASFIPPLIPMKKRTLGIKRPKTDILGQLQKQSNKIISKPSVEETIVIDEDIIEDDIEKESGNTSNLGSKDNSIVVDDGSSDDDFNDSLDEELLHIPIQTRQPSEESVEQRIMRDEEYPLTFNNNEGFLNEEQKDELYTYYYLNLGQPLDAIDPTKGINSPNYNFPGETGIIKNSKVTQQLFTVLKAAKSHTIQQYKDHKDKSYIDDKDTIDYLNKFVVN